MSTPILPPVKRCSKCGEEKPATPEHFRRKKLNSDVNLEARCIRCQNEYQKLRARERSKNPEVVQKRREKQRNYYQRNRESCIARVASYAAANKEVIRERSRNYYIKNKERHNQKAREYYRTHREQIKAWVKAQSQIESVKEKNRERIRQWKTKNKDRVLVLERQYRLASRAVARSKINKLRYRARKLDLPDTLTQEQWQRSLDYFNGCCAVCGKQLKDLFGTHKPAADHWIPLNSPDCLGTVVENMIPLCHGRDGCNNSKHDKSPEYWLVWRYGKRKAKAILDRINAYFEWAKQQ